MTDTTQTQATIATPSAANILNDIEQAITLIVQFKADLALLHPSVINIVGLLLKGL